MTARERRSFGPGRTAPGSFFRSCPESEAIGARPAGLAGVRTRDRRFERSRCLRQPTTVGDFGAVVSPALISARFVSATKAVRWSVPVRARSHSGRRALVSAARSTLPSIASWNVGRAAFSHPAPSPRARLNATLGTWSAWARLRAPVLVLRWGRGQAL